jgi:hypothetical protein
VALFRAIQDDQRLDTSVFDSDDFSLCHCVASAKGNASAPKKASRRLTATFFDAGHKPSGSNDLPRRFQ